MAVTMTFDQYQTLINALREGGEEGATGVAGAAAKEGPLEPCALVKDKLKWPMRWTNWHREAENKMRLMGITDNHQRKNYLRRATERKEQTETKTERWQQSKTVTITRPLQTTMRTAVRRRKRTVRAGGVKSKTGTSTRR